MKCLIEMWFLETYWLLGMHKMDDLMMHWKFAGICKHLASNPILVKIVLREKNDSFGSTRVQLYFIILLSKLMLYI